MAIIKNNVITPINFARKTNGIYAPRNAIPPDAISNSRHKENGALWEIEDMGDAARYMEIVIIEKRESMVKRI